MRNSNINPLLRSFKDRIHFNDIFQALYHIHLDNTMCPIIFLTWIVLKCQLWSHYHCSLNVFGVLSRAQLCSYWWLRNRFTVTIKRRECAQTVATTLRKYDTDQFLPSGTRQYGLTLETKWYKKIEIIRASSYVSKIIYMACPKLL